MNLVGITPHQASHLNQKQVWTTKETSSIPGTTRVQAVLEHTSLVPPFQPAMFQPIQLLRRVLPALLVSLSREYWEDVLPYSFLSYASGV